MAGGDQEEVDMHVLLPDLHPWNLTDKAAFESNAADARGESGRLSLRRVSSMVARSGSPFRLNRTWP